LIYDRTLGEELLEIEEYLTKDEDYIKIRLNELDHTKKIGVRTQPIIYLNAQKYKQKYCKVWLNEGFTGEKLIKEQIFKIHNLHKIISVRGSFIKYLKRVFDDPLPDQVFFRVNKFVTEVSELFQSADSPIPLITEENESVEIPREIEAEASRMLELKNPMSAIRAHLDNLIAGEEDNKIFVFVLLLSGKVKDPKKKAILVAVHDSGVGKTYLLKTISGFFKTHTVSHLTKRALNYAEKVLDKKEILFIKELGYLDREGDTAGTASIKFMSTDDQGLETTYTYRDKDGKFQTETRRLDPITIATSTTRTRLDKQFVRRNWIFSPDDSAEQTDRIRKFKEKLKYQENQKKLGLIDMTDFERSQLVLKIFVNKLEPVDILVPFHGAVYGIMDKRNLRVRGDFDKVSLFLELYGMLNKNNLPKIESNGKILYVLTPERAVEALKIARMPLVYMSRATEARDYKIIQVLKEIEKEEGLTVYPDKKISWTGGEQGVIDTRIQNEMVLRLGKDRKTVRAYLDKLEARGHLFEVNERPKIYALAKPVKTIEAEMSGYRDLDDEALVAKLIEDMQKEVNNFFDENNIDFRFSIGEKTCVVDG